MLEVGAGGRHEDVERRVREHLVRVRVRVRVKIRGRVRVRVRVS